VDFDRRIERRRTSSLKWELYGDALPLWVADMDFAAPPAVVEAVRRRAEHGVYGYTIVPPSLEEAILEHLAVRYGWAIERDWLVMLPGVVTGVALCCDAFLAAGEEALTITPAYPPFLEVPGERRRGLVTVEAEVRDGGWQLPLEAIEAAVTPRTRLLIFCHPHNPLGRVWSAGEAAAVVELCRRRDLVLVSDEIHCDLILDDLPHVPTASLGEEAAAATVTLMAPSKTFNLPGLDFAFAVVPDPVLRRRFAAAGKGVLPLPNCFAPAAAEAAYREGEPWRQELLAYLRGNRDLVEAWVAERAPRLTMTHVEATYLAWLDARGSGLDDVWRACLEAGAALSAGRAFGAPGRLRLNFGCPRSVLEEALRCLEPVFA
jgi:cystathionine beta-lyase